MSHLLEQLKKKKKKNATNIKCGKGCEEMDHFAAGTVDGTVPLEKCMEVLF